MLKSPTFFCYLKDFSCLWIIIRLWPTRQTYRSEQLTGSRKDKPSMKAPKRQAVARSSRRESLGCRRSKSPAVKSKIVKKATKEPNCLKTGQDRAKAKTDETLTGKFDRSKDRSGSSSWSSSGSSSSSSSNEEASPKVAKRNSVTLSENSSEWDHEGLEVTGTTQRRQQTSKDLSAHLKCGEKESPVLGFSERLQLDLRTQ